MVIFLHQLAVPRAHNVPPVNTWIVLELLVQIVLLVNIALLQVALHARTALLVLMQVAPVQALALLALKGITRTKIKL